MGDDRWAMPQHAGAESERVGQASDKRGVGQHHGDLRRALLDAALGLIDEDPEGRGARLSLRAVARRAGVSAGAPYHHFEDREALLAAAAEEGFRALRAVVSAARQTQDTPSAALEAMVAAYLRFAAGRPAHYRLMFAPRLDDGRHRSLVEAAFAAFAVLESAVVALVPGLPEAEAKRRAVLAWAFTHGAAQLTVDGLLFGLGGFPHGDVDRVAREVGARVLASCRDA